MRFGWVLALAVAWLGACGSFGGDADRPGPADPDASSSSSSSSGSSSGFDAALPDGGIGDGGAPRCSPTATFGTPEKLQIGSMTKIAGVRFSADEQTAFFWSTQRAAGGQAGLDTDLFFATRADDGSFADVVPFTNLNTGDDEGFPFVTADGKTIFFDRGPVGQRRLFSATRSATSAKFGDLAEAGPAGKGPKDQDDANPWVSGDTLYFSSYGLNADLTTDYDVFKTPLPLTKTSEYTPVSSLESPNVDSSAVLTADELTVYFTSERTDPQRGDIFVARRATRAEGFGTADRVAELSTASTDVPTWVSPDGCVLYYVVDGETTFSAQRGH